MHQNSDKLVLFQIGWHKWADAPCALCSRYRYRDSMRHTDRLDGSLIKETPHHAHHELWDATDGGLGRLNGHAIALAEVINSGRCLRDDIGYWDGFGHGCPREFEDKCGDGKPDSDEVAN